MTNYDTKSPCGTTIEQGNAISVLSWHYCSFCYSRANGNSYYSYSSPWTWPSVTAIGLLQSLWPDNRRERVTRWSLNFPPSHTISARVWYVLEIFILTLTPLILKCHYTGKCICISFFWWFSFTKVSLSIQQLQKFLTISSMWFL